MVPRCLQVRLPAEFFECFDQAGTPIDNGAKSVEHNCPDCTQFALRCFRYRREGRKRLEAAELASAWFTVHRNTFHCRRPVDSRANVCLAAISLAASQISRDL